MKIVQEYSGDGRCGVNIAGREGLNQLTAGVEDKRANFTSFLVYDVSRWGRSHPVQSSRQSCTRNA
jgi:DNA invertase Pin-like site-specific DNA recombinase